MNTLIEKVKRHRLFEEEPKSVMNVALGVELLSKYKSVAKREAISLAKLTRIIIEDFIKNYGEAEK